MQKFETIWQNMRRAGQAIAGGLARIVSALLSNRGLALLTLAACAALAISPWLRPAMSRDFRGIHIPWSTLAGKPFFPPYSAPVPRPWLWTGIATPILIAVAIGIFLVVTRRHRIATALGLVLAASIPSVAVAWWNHPGLFEFFESEVRQRALLRDVFRQQSEELLTGSSPDRLAYKGNMNTQAGSSSSTHPVLVPLSYSLYGPWIVCVAGVGVVLASRGSLGRRLVYTAGWGAVGLAFAAAVTLPRWVAEYHFLQASSHENNQRLSEAEQSLEQVRLAMPSLEYTRRYQLVRGRLAYRQGLENDYTAFFVAHQHAVAGDCQQARLILSPTTGMGEASIAARELLAEIVGHLAAGQVAAGDMTSAELMWNDATQLAPWMPGHWIAQSTTALAANPSRAEEYERDLLPRLDQVGDRLVSSDVASVIGDAYFNTGQFAKARSMYDQSLATFHLPKNANLKAQEGRLGM